jgi:hypothetical protein
VSHQTPLHPDADLAVVLDDLRQNVAAWGDEGMVMRVFRASICLMLLSILDTLIELLADFRAGRLPPVLPALDESPAGQARIRRTGPSPTVPSNVRRTRAAPTIAPDSRRVGDSSTIPAKHNTGDHRPAPPRLTFPRHEDTRRAAAGYPSRVPRPPWRNFGTDTPSRPMSTSLRYQNEKAPAAPYRRPNSRSSSPRESFKNVGRPWLHVAARGVASICRSSASISGAPSRRPARMLP